MLAALESEHYQEGATVKTVDTWRQGAWMGAVGGELHVGRAKYDGERRTDGVPWDVLHAIPQIPALYAEQCASQHEVPDEVVAAVESVVAIVRRLKDGVSAGRRSAQAVDTSLPSDLRRMGEVGAGFGDECLECGRPGVVVTAGYGVCLHCGRLGIGDCAVIPSMAFKRAIIQGTKT